MDLAGVRVVYVCIIQIGFKLDVGRLADVRAPTLLLLGGSSPLAMRDGTEAIAGALPNAGYPRRVRALISRYRETAMLLAVLAGLFFVVGRESRVGGGDPRQLPGEAWRSASRCSAAGAERLLFERVLEQRSLLRHVEAAIPGAQITVVRLRAPLQVIEKRVSIVRLTFGRLAYPGCALANGPGWTKRAIKGRLVDNGDDRDAVRTASTNSIGPF
ncbi:MAG: hypothetical protein E6I27_13330 [Chloroflexi bacterium]|nr:MAG: hypothetical protein E6I27_13330 [Chloroflexota bacterium]